MPFWDVLLKNLVLLHVLLPCVTLAITLVLAKAAPRRVDLVRFIALQACLLSLACGISILMRFDPGLPNSDHPEFSQMVSGGFWRPWTHAPSVSLVVGVDGLNLWYLVTLPWVALSLVLWEAPRGTWRYRDFCCLMSLFAAAILAFAARDLLLLATGATVGLVSLLIWIRPVLGLSSHGLSSGLNAAARGIAFWGVVAGAGFGFATALSVVSQLQIQERQAVSQPHLSTDIDAIAFGTPEAARSFVHSQLAWRQQAVSIFVAFCLAALCCAGAWPLQETLVRGLRQTPAGPRIAMLCGLMPLGTYVAIRVFVPLLGEFIARGQGWIIGPVLVSLIWHLGLLSYSERPQDGPLRICLASQLLSVVAAVTGTTSGFCGALLISLSAGWSYAAWLMLGPEDGFRDDAVGLATSPADPPPTPARWLVLALICGCPGGGMFAGLWLVAMGMMQGLQGSAFGVTLLPLIGLIWLLLAGNAFRRARIENTAAIVPSHNMPGRHAGAACLVALTIAAGILSAKAVERSLRTASLISQRVTPAPVQNGQ